MRSLSEYGIDNIMKNELHSYVPLDIINVS